jgi:hypothetical protein
VPVDRELGRVAVLALVRGEVLGEADGALVVVAGRVEQPEEPGVEGVVLGVSKDEVVVARPRLDPCDRPRPAVLARDDDDTLTEQGVALVLDVGGGRVVGDGVGVAPDAVADGERARRRRPARDPAAPIPSTGSQVPVSHLTPDSHRSPEAGRIANAESSPYGSG